MTDLSNQWLLQQIKQGSDNELVCICDTFFDDADDMVLGKQKKLHLFSNRYNFHVEKKTITATYFNDFDFSVIAPQSLNAFYLRIPKEKALCHYLINQAGILLKPGGTLFLAGHKNEGIKTYFKKAKAYLQGSASEKKKQGSSFTCIQRSATLSSELDCNNYLTLRTITPKEGAPFSSKPGIFGWDKVDKGSQLLVNQLGLIAQSLPKKNSVLDLGCGYGFLSLQAIKQLSVQEITATDNNATALIACEDNLKKAISANKLSTLYSILPSHGGDKINTSFSLILCNPPFHQGFTHDSYLIELFLSNAARLLKTNGVALFVVNDFIPLEQAAKKHFKRIDQLTSSHGFSVYSLSQL